jgi:hypothetical protein
MEYIFYSFVLEHALYTSCKVEAVSANPYFKYVGYFKNY